MLNSFLDKFLFTNSLHYKNHNFFLVNMPFLLVPTQLLADVIARNDLDGNKKIYYTVKDSTLRHLLPQLDSDFRIEEEELVSLIEKFFSSFGWGEIHNIDFDEEKKRAIVDLRNSPFASLLKGKTTRPVDHLLRGVIAGLFQHIFKEEMDCVELRCSVLGENECELIVNKASEFDFSKEETHSQLNNP